MKRKSITAADAVAQLQADPAFTQRESEREKQIRALEKILRADEAALVAELNACGLRVKSVWDLVNSANDYSKAVPVLLKHLQAAHHKRTREGIIRALTIKYGGAENEDALLQHFARETDAELRWCLANALKTAMSNPRRKQFPEIEAVFRSEHRIQS